MWKVENVLHELSDLAQESSKQTVEGVAWLLLVTYSKMHEDRDKLWGVLINKQESGFGKFENSLTSHYKLCETLHFQLLKT